MIVQFTFVQLWAVKQAYFEETLASWRRCIVELPHVLDTQGPLASIGCERCY